MWKIPLRWRALGAGLRLLSQWRLAFMAVACCCSILDSPIRLTLGRQTKLVHVPSARLFCFRPVLLSCLVCLNLTWPDVSTNLGRYRIPQPRNPLFYHPIEAVSFFLSRTSLDETMFQTRESFNQLSACGVVATARYATVDMMHRLDHRKFDVAHALCAV